MVLPFALHLAPVSPLFVCCHGSFPGESTSFHCEQEKDGDKDGEIRRDGRGGVGNKGGRVAGGKSRQLLESERF